MTLRVYADTSVFGGVFDPEFDSISREFFAQVQSGLFVLVTSVLVAEEIQSAPQKVVDWFDLFLPDAEIVDIDANAFALKDSYLKARIVGGSSEIDAFHVAIATCSKCRALISWNFKHIVHFGKIPLYNAVNVINGYDPISINSPAEIINYEE